MLFLRKRTPGFLLCSSVRSFGGTDNRWGHLGRISSGRRSSVTNNSMNWTLVACSMAPSFTQAGVGVAYYSAPGPVSRAASYGAGNGYTALRYEFAAQRG